MGIDYCTQLVNFGQQKYDEVDDLYFYKGDIEKLDKVKILEGLRFDLVLCIETFHCLVNPEGMLS